MYSLCDLELNYELFVNALNTTSKSKNFLEIRLCSKPDYAARLKSMFMLLCQPISFLEKVLIDWLIDLWFNEHKKKVQPYK